MSPYFDRYHLHHYVALPAYSRAYGRHRAVSGGRSLWTTEFNLPVHWADEATHEPSDDELRVQGFRVGKVFAQALHEGSEKAFYFILGHYVERNLQYGLVHHDLTPRPAYVAFAAVGRLLNGAKPLGRVDLGNDKLKAYVFNTVVDGARPNTIVAWSETTPTRVAFSNVEDAYDYLGRPLPLSNEFELTRETKFLVLPDGQASKLSLEAPPAKPQWRQGEACPVVLQLVGVGDSAKSAFRLSDSNELQLAVYNFGAATVSGKLQLEGAAIDDAQIEIAPGERAVRTINVEDASRVAARLDVGELGTAIVVGNMTRD